MELLWIAKVLQLESVASELYIPPKKYEYCSKSDFFSLSISLLTTLFASTPLNNQPKMLHRNQLTTTGSRHQMIRAAIATYLLITIAFADTRISKENLKSGDLFKDSLSSQGVGLYCINLGATTATNMVLMGKTKDKALATIPIRSTYSTHKKHKNWLTVKWNEGGTMVAIHDALDKHSKVLIYRKGVDDRFHPVSLPDLLKIEGGGRLGLILSTIVSSGQEPEKWRNDNILMVKYRFKTKDGKLYRRTLPISIDESGKYQQQ